MRVFLIGLVIWFGGTVGVRLVGHRFLEPDRNYLTVALYVVSFVLMGLLARWICRWFGIAKDLRVSATTLLILPTLILDSFSCAFFTTAFPNVDPGAAGIFGGWMLICCGGAVSGAWLKL